MKFTDIPTIFLSFAEENADANFAHLLTLNPNAQRVHGVKGFDAAHKAASAKAKSIDPSLRFFITVDGDNTTLPDFWNLDYRNIPVELTEHDRFVLSWNAYNPLTGLHYGNGGLKLWSHQFITDMVTHEQTEGKVVDFCWDPGYFQLAKIFSVTKPYSTPRQAFVAGFREGAKMPLVDGKPLDSVYEVVDRAYRSNIERLTTWCSVGNHEVNGQWSISGALYGFWSVHVSKKIKLTRVSDLEFLSTIYDDWNRLNPIFEGYPDNPEMRQDILAKTGIDIPQFGAKQSKFVVERTRPFNNYTAFERESWPTPFTEK